MACGHCKDCGTGLDRNGVCPNCDEVALIMDWQDPQNPSDDFQREAAEGWKRASKRTKQHAQGEG